MRNRNEVLYEVVRIANRSAFDFPHSSKQILRFLGRALELETVSLFLLDPRRKALSQVVHNSGNHLFLPCSRSLKPGPEQEAVRGRQPVRREDGWLFPLIDGRRILGLLSVRARPERDLSADFLDILATVCEEIARLIHIEQLRQQERRQLTQLTLLAELGRQLNQVRNLDELQDITLKFLLRQGRASAVVFRLLFGEAEAGPTALLHQPELGGLNGRLTDLEEKHYPAAIAAGAPVFRRVPWKGGKGRPPAGLEGMVMVPLAIENRKLGVLTIFGGGDPFFSAGRGERRFLTAVGSQVVHALERVWSRELLEALSAENDRKLQEISLLYRISRAIHSTLRLNELMHLILSAAVAPGGGGFGRAMLFTCNERTQTLQGMLCVTRETSALILPPENGAKVWDRPVVTDEARQAQRDSPDCRRVMKQRLPLLSTDNPLARAVQSERVIFVASPSGEMAETLGLGPYACAPLLGRNRPLGVLLVDNPDSPQPLTSGRRRFLELFANHAGAAIENSMLLHRLETAHQDLRETQERLIQGEKMAVLGEMAASIAHEMRNPLVPIGGFAERLARLLPAESRESEYAAIISKEVRRMEEMLSNILAFSRKQMLCFSTCRVEEVIEDALDLERDDLDRSGIEVVREVADDLPVVQCDDRKMRQVIINLITNARQAMADGGTLAVRAYRSALRGEEAVAIEIEDSGGGISAEVLHNIFNPFFTTKEKGTGLGLSISHRIVEHHRGEIEVKNREKGVLFTIRLPARASELRSASRH